MAVSNAAEPKLTECTVCHEAFSVPKLLPCGHRLCRDCLVTLMRSQPQAGCPLCRCVIVDPTEPGGRSVEEVADGFPTDLAMTAMVEAETLLSKQHVCCVCLDVAAVALCLQCGDMFCQNCTNVHKRQTVSRHHQVEDLISLTVEKLATHNPSTCPDHKDEVAKIYCPKHRSSVCLLCALSDHGDCPQKVKLQSRVDELAAELAQVNTMVSGAEAKSEIKLSLLDKLVKVLQKQCKAAQDQIKTTGDRLKAAIDARVTYTKQLASKMVSDVIQKAEEVKKKIINNQCKMSTHRNLTELYKNFKDHKSFNDMVSLIKKRVQELDLDPKLPDEVCLYHSLTLTIESQAVARTEKEISELGEIALTSPKLLSAEKPQTKAKLTLASVSTRSSSDRAAVKGAKSPSTSPTNQDEVQWSWVEVQPHGERLRPYPPSVSSAIESAYQSGQTNVSIAYENKVGYRIRFSTMDEIPESSVKVIRQNQLAITRTLSCPLPNFWSPIVNGDLDVVALSPGTAEYKTVYDKFFNSLKSPLSRVVRIDRIQNFALYQKYTSLKQKMDLEWKVKFDSLNKSSFVIRYERQDLWHGTREEVVDSVIKYGLNRSFVDLSKNSYGHGAYLATSVQELVRDGYAVTNAMKQRTVLLCRALVGRYTVGTPDMRSPHGNYHSTVDSLLNPSIFVIYNDKQAYPDYRIVFTDS